ncbi:MAG: hypothetical protein GTO14_20100 [Anaerolineales bacterium]|nr:hypothetical protein [Anaerolineales bacterium]
MLNSIGARLVTAFTCARDRRSINTFRLLRLMFLGFVTIVFTSCLSVRPVLPPTPSATLPTSTQTFVFPSPIPTATFSPEPTSTPTPDLLVGLGNVIFSDEFNTNKGWELKQSDIGGSSIFNSHLNLAVREPHSFYSVRSPSSEAPDFFLEVSARVEVCSEGDEYGILFRLNNFYEHYRFTLTCEGNARVSRILQDGEVALVPTTQTYAVIPGLKVSNTIGIWVSGGTFQFFINDVQVFSARDDELTSGGLGLFVRTRRSGLTTVSFDYFTVRALLPTATPTVTPSPG